MYVCMYVFMYVCMYVCMYACMYLCMMYDISANDVYRKMNIAKEKIWIRIPIVINDVNLGS